MRNPRVDELSVNGFGVNGLCVDVFCVDHDHVTGKVRELLCKDCNIVLGIINDSPEHLGRLMAYIIKHKDD